MKVILKNSSIVFASNQGTSYVDAVFGSPSSDEVKDRIKYYIKSSDLIKVESRFPFNLTCGNDLNSRQESDWNWTVAQNETSYDVREEHQYNVTDRTYTCIWVKLDHNGTPEDLKNAFLITRKYSQSL